MMDSEHRLFAIGWICVAVMVVSLVVGMTTAYTVKIKAGYTNVTQTVIGGR